MLLRFLFNTSLPFFHHIFDIFDRRFRLLLCLSGMAPIGFVRFGLKFVWPSSSIIIDIPWRSRCESFLFKQHSIHTFPKYDIVVRFQPLLIVRPMEVKFSNSTVPLLYNCIQDRFPHSFYVFWSQNDSGNVSSRTPPLISSATLYVFLADCLRFFSHFWNVWEISSFFFSSTFFCQDWSAEPGSSVSLHLSGYLGFCWLCVFANS